MTNVFRKTNSKAAIFLIAAFELISVWGYYLPFLVSVSA
jgi:hypothetical protein